MICANAAEFYFWNRIPNSQNKSRFQKNQFFFKETIPRIGYGIDFYNWVFVKLTLGISQIIELKFSNKQDGYSCIDFFSSHHLKTVWKIFIFKTGFWKWILKTEPESRVRVTWFWKFSMLSNRYKNGVPRIRTRIDWVIWATSIYYPFWVSKKYPIYYLPYNIQIFWWK